MDLNSYNGTNHFIISKLKDEAFVPNKTAEFTILGLSILYFVPSTIYYILNRTHPTIKYKQPRNVFIGAILSTINMCLMPIIRYYKINCLVNTWINSSLIFSFVNLTFSRYIKVFYMQRLSIFKLQFSEKKKEKIHEKNDITLKVNMIKAKSNLGSLKSNSIEKDSFNFDSLTLDSFNVADPVLYFKRLNSIINRKITFYLVILPITCLLVYYLFITIKDWDAMMEPCINESKDVSIPKIVFNGITFTTSIYLFYQAYYKQKWDIDIKIEYTSFILVSLFCTIIMQFAIRGKFGDTILLYRLYIFQLTPITIHNICVMKPIIQILISKLKKKDESMLSEEEFLDRLSDSSFKGQVREIAVQTFCIENLLFFETHHELMNFIIAYYSKRSTLASLNENNGFENADVLHKSVINPCLHNPFKSIFKPQFEQIYSLYIKEDGIASININSSTLKAIEDQVENNNFSYLMFNQAAEEVGELLYSNIYPKMSL